MNDPASHGFTLPSVDDEIEFDRVPIEKQVHLKTVAKHLDIPYNALKDLNPELRKNCSPNRPYAIKVPKGKGEVLLAKIGDIPVWHPPVPAYVTHKVRKGESLSVIARRYRTSVRAIMALNNLNRKHYIKAGWRLKIPTGKTYAGIKKTSQPVYRHTGKRPETYRVRKGDSLWKIARLFGTTTKAIQSLNNLNKTHLRVGQVLKIPKASSSFASIKTKPYTVLKGDSSYIIAQKHKMSLSQLLSINYLTPRSTIYPGQTLLVKAQ
jgi:membrane-bound lytic murein transglycosylase D